MSAIKHHYERVNAPGSHSSSNNPGDHEDLLELDQLCIQLYVEYQEALDIQEAIRCNSLLDKENVHNASQFLAPNPQPLPHSGTLTHNPLSTISNEAPALVNDTVSPKPPVGTGKNARLYTIPMKSWYHFLPLINNWNLLFRST